MKVFYSLKRTNDRSYLSKRPGLFSGENLGVQFCNRTLSYSTLTLQRGKFLSRVTSGSLDRINSSVVRSTIATVQSQTWLTRRLAIYLSRLRWLAERYNVKTQATLSLAALTIRPQRSGERDHSCFMSEQTRAIDTWSCWRRSFEPL